MKILILHNYYQRPGGEDTIFHNEINLLREQGHQIVIYSKHNNQIKNQSKLISVLETIWSFRSFREISEIIKKEKPNIAYFFNTFPIISPSAYYACKKRSIPVIQVLANPRFMCPKAMLYRDGKLCLDCVGKYFPWPGIVHRCYHRSALQTAIIAIMLTFHKIIGTWEKKVDYYFVATKFYIDLYAKAGLPKNKLVFKPHFVPKFPNMSKKKNSERYALFVGRLDPEKGVRTLLNAWKELDIPLKIRGNGLMDDELNEFIETNSCNHIVIVPRLSSQDLFELMDNASFLVVPSEGYYETFGMVIIESFSMGVPVLTSNIGVMSEIVEDGKTGVLFSPGDAENLAHKAKWLWNNPEDLSKLGENARKEYERLYTPEVNYQRLMEIYEFVMKSF